jgi:hypothetical protein
MQGKARSISTLCIFLCRHDLAFRPINTFSAVFEIFQSENGELMRNLCRLDPCNRVARQYWQGWERFPRLYITLFIVPVSAKESVRLTRVSERVVT